MDAGLDHAKFHSAREVESDNEARRLHKDQNAQSFRAHLRSTVAQPKAEASSHAYMKNKLQPPDDDRLLLNTIKCWKRVRGRPKETHATSSRPTSTKNKERTDCMKD